MRLKNRSGKGANTGVWPGFLSRAAPERAEPGMEAGGPAGRKDQCMDHSDQVMGQAQEEINMGE